jgi:hypothetical protein
VGIRGGWAAPGGNFEWSIFLHILKIFVYFEAKSEENGFKRVKF